MKKKTTTNKTSIDYNCTKRTLKKRNGIQWVYITWVKAILIASMDELYTVRYYERKKNRFIHDLGVIV